MDHQWFDDLTRSLAAEGLSRRQSLKLLGGSLAGELLALVGVGHIATYARFNFGFISSSALADDRLTDADFGFSTFEPLTYRDTGYRFQIIPLDAAPPSGWEQPGFDDSGFDEGSAAFGSGGGCPLQSTVQTSWPINSQLLVRRVVSVPAPANNLRIMVSADNDIMGVFFNGTPLVEHLLGTEQVTHGECPIPDEFRFNVPPSLMQPGGEQIVAVHVLDRGVESFFDARILADLPINLAATCSNNNTVEVPCEQLSEYVRNCGVFCPSGLKLEGKAGCTECRFRTPAFSAPSRPVDGVFGGVCVSRTVTRSFVRTFLDSRMIDYQLPQPPCCQDECRREVDKVLDGLRRHEEQHRANFMEALAQAQRDWPVGRRIEGCGADVRSAREALRLRFAGANADIARTARAVEIACTCEKEADPRTNTPECPQNVTPPEPAGDIDCGKCVPAKLGRACISGTCQDSGCTRSSRCPTAVDCSRRGQLCLCLTTAEGDIRCGRSVSSSFCRSATPCITSAPCERIFGQGWFCQLPGTGCCGCARLPSGEVVCGEAGVCVPPC